MNFKGVVFVLWGLVVLTAVLNACTPNPVQTIEPITFVDVAQDVGLDFQHGAFRWEMSGDPVAMMGGGVCWLDFDRDGWQDLYVVNSYAVAEAGRWQTEMDGLPQSVLYRNVEGRFENVSEQSGMAISMRGNGCVAADFNLDGFSDLYVTTSRSNLLFWNQGDGTFIEGGVASESAAYGWQTAAAVGDINSDGWPDIFLAGYVDVNNQIEGSTMGFPNTNYGIRDLLYLNNGPNAAGQITFMEVGEIVGLETADFEYGLGAIMSDMDHDGDLDLFVANDTNPNRLYTNEPMENDPEGLGFRLVELDDSPAVRDTNSGMGVASGDFDNNGRSDLFITNMGAQFHSIYQNKSAERVLAMQNVVEEIGVAAFGAGWTGWGTNWGDYDLDGDVDLFVANGSIPVIDLANDGQLTQLYDNLTAQGEAGKLVDLTDSSGLQDVGELIGRGSATADYDNDGDLDIAVGTIGGQLVLLENRGATGNWLTVDLLGVPAGALVTAVLPDGRELHREVLAGSSYLSSNDARCHFGLGTADEVVELHVQWPNGETTILTDVEINQIVQVSNR